VTIELWSPGQEGASDDNPASSLYNVANLYSRARLGTCPILYMGAYMNRILMHV